MRMLRTLLAVVVLICLAGASNSQQSAPGRPPVRAANPGVLPVGPRDSLDVARTVSGQVRVVVTPPRGVMPKEVELFIDSASIGKSPLRPYKQSFEAGDLAAGAHVLKAVGRDQSGKEIWTASTAIKTGEPSGSEKPRESTAPVQMGEAVEPLRADVSAGRGRVLENTFTSRDYGFSIKYPAGWTYRDQTAKMKPKLKNGFWIVFGTSPLEKSPLVVNVRRGSLDANIDAEAFAKGNPYVQRWDRKTLNGNPAFMTTSVADGGKELVHRAIILMDGAAWMLNCRVKSGKSKADTAALFEGMVNSLYTWTPAISERVRVTVIDASSEK